MAETAETDIPLVCPHLLTELYHRVAHQRSIADTFRYHGFMNDLIRQLDYDGIRKLGQLAGLSEQELRTDYDTTPGNIQRIRGELSCWGMTLKGSFPDEPVIPPEKAAAAAAENVVKRRRRKEPEAAI